MTGVGIRGKAWHIILNTDQKKILSEEEHAKEVAESWIALLFILGEILINYIISLLFQFYSPNEYPKSVKFAAIIIGGGIAGFLLARLHRIIRFLLSVGFVLAVLDGFGLLGLDRNLANNHMHSDSKKPRSFVALLFAVGDVKRYVL